MPGPHEGDLAYGAMLRALGLIERVMQPYFAQFGITGSQWGVLRTLHQAQADGGPGLRLTDLSHRLIIRPPSVSGVVDRLEKMGLVIREGVAGDLRVKRVKLTGEGRRLIEKIAAAHPAQIAALLGALSEADQANLHRLLEKLNEHLNQIAG